MQHTTTLQNIIITGSSGLIGTALVERFAGAYRVFAVDRKEPTSPLPPQAEYAPIDLTSEASVREVLSRVQARCSGTIAAVIHLAAYYDFSGEPSDLYEQITVRGTERLLRALHDLVVEQFVFSSTMLVHRPTEPGHPIREDAPLEGKWDYPQSKIATEQLIRAQHGAIPIVLLRIAGVYTDTCDSIPIAHQIQRIYEKRLTGHVYPGDTSRGQAFVHLEDLVEALWRTVERRAKLPREAVMLLGEPIAYGYDHIQRELARLLHGEDDWTTHQIPKVVAKTGAWVQDTIPGIAEPFIKPWMIDMADDHYELDSSRARELLGWQPQHRLLETLPRMTDALQADPVGWYKRHKLDLSGLPAQTAAP